MTAGADYFIGLAHLVAQGILSKEEAAAMIPRAIDIPRMFKQVQTPENPADGDLWWDGATLRLYVASSATWKTITLT